MFIFSRSFVLSASLFLPYSAEPFSKCNAWRPVSLSLFCSFCGQELPPVHIPTPLCCAGFLLLVISYQSSPIFHIHI